LGYYCGKLKCLLYCDALLVIRAFHLTTIGGFESGGTLSKDGGYAAATASDFAAGA
jgi:hypothetical protein